MENLENEEITIQPLTEEQVKEIREIFALYETQTPGMISQVNICEVMFELGVFRTEAEINRLLKEFELERNEEVTVVQFLDVMTKIYQQMYNKDSLKAAFDVLDNTKNHFINGSDLRHVALSMGIKFTDLEFEEMFKEIDFDADANLRRIHAYQESSVGLKPRTDNLKTLSSNYS
ncbi:calmodulin-like [Drosophila rhopaloa]|uniref:EF-hand domain-containing protein n=1 Tax=Drosophila rhopaloa TaxID=1041015 RepID=A0ABM5JFU5_DRORH|nr:calmodulin-like [Drosophila rhopaloa]